jgi:hypothetical protein
MCDMEPIQQRKSNDRFSTTAESHLLGEAPDFSVVLGGPLYQLLRKAHLEGDYLRRIFFFAAIAWLPLLLLAGLSPVVGSASRISFFQDVEVHVRFLAALPVLIAAERLVDSRLKPILRRFVERRIILPEEFPRFESAVNSAMRLRNSVAAEIIVLACAYIIGLWLWHSRVDIATDTWYARAGGRWSLTAAGIWYVFISMPIVQFILLRWYFRFLILIRLIWQVSRMNLNLIPNHPDRCAGLGFLGKTSYAFSPILFAQGALLSGMVATRVLYQGERLLSFQLQIFGFVAFFVVMILGPLFLFTPQMATARRKGSADYGLLASRYVESFQHRWVGDAPIQGEELLGTRDIQSLADLVTSYHLVRDMRVVPFGLDDITHLAAVTASPFLPLLLTVWSPEELIMRIIKVVF